MPLDPNIDYERLGAGDRFDETDINLRAYMCRIPDDKIAQYRPDWTDDQTIEWCGDFTDEGNLLLVCSEREVDVHAFREVLEVHLKHRPLV